MSLRKQIVIIALVTIAIMGAIGSVSWQKRHEFISREIEKFQENQLSFISQVAQKVQFSFAKLGDDLYSLSQIPEVQSLEKNTCLLNMVRIQKLNRHAIDSIYRADAKGHIRYGFPHIDCPVQGEELAKVFSHVKMTGKSCFQVIRKKRDGGDFLVIAQPVYTVQGDVHLNPSNKFSGIIFFITTLEKLRDYFFATSSFGDRGYPWAITSEKLLISTGNDLHLGKIFDEFLPLELPGKEQFEIRDVLTRMVQGESGVGRYSYRLHQDVQKNFIKLTAFTPLKLPNQRWSIAVSNPLSDVLNPLEKQTAELRFYVLSLIVIMAGMALLIILLLRRNHLEQLSVLRLKDAENSRIRKEWQVTFDTVDSMIFLLNRELTIIRANQAALMLQSEPGQNLMENNLALILADVTGYPVEIPVDDILGGDTPFACKLPCRDSEKTFLMTFVPVKDEAGYHIDLICYLKDISEMEVLEEQYHRAQKMESIGMMAGGVAHDLNNILSGIVSYPELILLKLPEESELRRPIEMIQNSGIRAAAVVDDLLTVARGVASVKIAVDLNTLVNAYLQSPECQKLQSLHPDVQFLTSLAPEVHTIQCSPVHIQKCLMNLVNNGAEAIGNTGQILISTQSFIYPGKGREEKNLQPGTYAVLMVSDNGSGISAKDQKRIFEPFYSKKVMGRSGTGLGLTVVWNTMQDHKGLVEIVSGAGGTDFVLYFPSTDSRIEKPLPPFDHARIMGQGERVLVVDDQELQRDIARQMLVTLGYEAIAVRSGEEAVEFLKENPMDLVLLDMVMDPGMDGCRTYEQILCFNSQQKAVLASGFAEDVLVKKALQLGVGALVKKPYSLKQLGVTIQSVLKGID